MPPKKYGRKRRAPLKRKSRTYKKRSFVKSVKKVINSQIESKVDSDYGSNLALNCATTLLSPTFYAMHPTPSSTSTGQSGRIGNEITVTGAVVRGRINCLPYNATTNPFESPIIVKMWLCRRKNSSVGINGNPTLAQFNQFFQAGSTTNGFGNGILDILFQVNRDYWTVVGQKQIQVQPWGLTTSTGIGGGSEKVSVPFSFSFAKHLGKLKYNDSGTDPTNKELFLVFQTVYSNGVTPPSGVTMAEVHFDTEYIYKDA